MPTRRSSRRRRADEQLVDERLAQLPTEALECRELRHAWPRPSHNGMTKLTPTRTNGGGRVTEAIREMTCTGGCGTVRVETFGVSTAGRLVRIRPPRYRHADGYLLKRADPADTRRAVDVESVRFALLQRLYPDLHW